MPPPTFFFEASWPTGDYDTTMVVGKKASMEHLFPQLLEPLGMTDLVPPAVVTALVQSLDDKTGGSPATTLLARSAATATVQKLTIAGLPSQLSRHNHPMAVHTLTKVVSGLKGDKARLVVLTDGFAPAPLALAIAKAFPVFSMKTSPGETKERTLHIIFVTSDGSVVHDPQQLQAAKAAAKGVQLTTRLVDSHPELMTTTQFSKEVQQLVQEHHPLVKCSELVGQELAEQGYGGLHGVGKAANCPPRLIVLEYDGGGDETVALVGKGIVFDTGGLSLKVRCSWAFVYRDCRSASLFQLIQLFHNHS